MIITLIAAHDPNLLIGANGELPWRYPEDLKHFKAKTLGKPILMGRGVFEELNEKPLPGRENIVLSTSKTYEHVPTYSSIDNALKDIDVPELMVIGGGKVYEQLLDSADKLIITLIHKEFEGDTYFPEYRDKIGTEWVEVSKEETEELSFIEYQRVASNSNLN
ncbi:MAG TPA: dihydrofolate reductase [Balneolaceae bacterium]|nr:dihydrofolate reductase [Balneolaceae bacterium]|tara:strand:+ start:45035 stop:45523 length:489 start_codon:yes stop_codon:yes gene_type:complete